MALRATELAGVHSPLPAMVQELSFQAFGDRLPPQNIDAEESILGGILLDPEAINRIVDLIRPEAFYLSAHQEIYRTMLTLHGQGSPTDLMSVTTWLRDRGILEKVGGQTKLVQLVDRTVSAVNIDQYANLVMDKYMRRKLIQVGNRIAHLGHDTSTDLEHILDQSEQEMFGVTQDRPQQGLTAASDILTHTFSDIESRSLGMVLPGLACGFYDLDAMTQGFQRSDLVIVAGRPSMGKCLAAESEILLADGQVVTIADLYRQHQAQQLQAQQLQAQPHAKLLTLGRNWRFHITAPSAFVDDGIKPVFRVTTRLGRSITTTLTHPYLTFDGWRPLAELRVGEKIAVPRRLAVFGDRGIPEPEVKLLSYLMSDAMSDACLTDPSSQRIRQFTHANPRLQADFAEAARHFLGNFSGNSLGNSLGNKTRRAPSPGPLALGECLQAEPTDPQHSLTLWRAAIGLAGKKAFEKEVPPIVFQLPQSHIALFLNRLFATDGWASGLAGGQCQVGYATVSERLARQVQHLLLRFGIIAQLQPRSRQQPTQRPVWQLNITDAPSMQTFGAEIGILGQEMAIAQVAAAGCAWQDIATSDVYWDEIVAIEPLGQQQVYDLTIPDTHNFVANDICVHNTSFTMNVARNIAAFHKLPVAVFSLEMSKEQLVQRLLASEVRIESGRLRAGRVSQAEWEPLGHAISVLSQLPIFIDDTPNISITEMRSKARRLQAEQGGALGLILLDYLQLMDGGSDNRVQELSKITRSLKGLARELRVPVIALSQLSRGVESRTNKRPMMSDLRESGAIEQDADLIMMLYRDEYYNPDTPDRGIAEVILTKHRNGPTGTVKLLFESQFTQFRNMVTPNRP